MRTNKENDDDDVDTTPSLRLEGTSNMATNYADDGDEDKNWRSVDPVRSGDLAN